MSRTIYGNIKENIDVYEPIEKGYKSLLLKYNCHGTYEHSYEVGLEAERLALRFNCDSEKAKIAGFYHDISAVIGRDQYLSSAEEMAIEILDEERQLPLIIHQKLSKKITQDMFGVMDEEILNAIGRHTTLHKNYTKLDLIVFLADKIAWDQLELAPFLQNIHDGLEISLERGAYEYVHYMLNESDGFKVLHPWMKDAYETLKLKIL